jgi:predicted nucleic acid-binding protein
MTPRIVVVDANILISAYGFDGEVRRHWSESLWGCKMVVSPEILIEVESGLRNSEFNLGNAEIKKILADILERCEVVRPNPVRDPGFKNAKDSHLAALAQYKFPDGARPEFLLTGDEALRLQGRIGNCEIRGIGEFCNSGDRRSQN